MSTFHNRMGFVTLALAATVLLIGAGCQQRRSSQNNGALDQGTSMLPSPTNDASVSLPTKWAEYRSAKLGITIPYPEGWYVNESSGDDGVTTILVDEGAPPTEDQRSDSSVRVTITLSHGTLNDALRSYEASAVDSVVDLNGRKATRVYYESELGAPTEAPARRTAYHWESGGILYTLDGERGDVVLERIANDLAAERR